MPGGEVWHFNFVRKANCPSSIAPRHEVIVLGLDHAQIKGVLCPQSEIKGQVGRDIMVCSPQTELARERQVYESPDSGDGRC